MNDYIFILIVALFFLVAVLGIWLYDKDQHQTCLNKCGNVEYIYNATGCYCRFKGFEDKVLKL